MPFADRADAIAFGRLLISNPARSRIQTHTALNPYDRKTFYGGDALMDTPTIQRSMLLANVLRAGLRTRSRTDKASHLCDIMSARLFIKPEEPSGRAKQGAMPTLGEACLRHALAS
ncbi:MAG: hypothetical protein V7L01_06825 [Nostoc sp.]|uniref:hypothetical protein n=1 Tax=Nostoc sp. TaxID=1180 RepID=UPI002FF4734F